MAETGMHFWRYLRLWFDTGRKGALDTFGSIATIVGFLLWIWNKRWPDSFKVVADQLGIKPDVAMSDLVWQVPAAVGLCALGYRFLRAPYEIHLQTIGVCDEQGQEISDLGVRIEQTESLVGVTRERQKTLDRLAVEMKTGYGYLAFAERGEPLSLFVGHVDRWVKEVGHLLQDQAGSDVYLRFLNANVPVQGRSVSTPFINDHATLAKRLRGQLDCLEALSRRLQTL